MKKTYTAFALAAALFPLLAIAGCMAEIEYPQQTNSGIRILADIEGPRTVIGDLAGSIVVWRATVYPAGSAAPSRREDLPRQLSFIQLEAGLWDIMLEGKNSNGLTVGRGTASGIKVEAGKETAIHILVKPTAGENGHILFRIRFPDAGLCDYAFAELTDAEGSAIPGLSGQVLEITEETANGSPTGFLQTVLDIQDVAPLSYRLSLTFKKGGSEGAEVLKLYESVTVHANLTADKWIEADGTLLDVLTLTSSDFICTETKLLSLSCSGAGGILPFTTAFEPAVRSYTLNAADFPSIKALGSLNGQKLEYSVNGGTWTALAEREATDPVCTVPGTYSVKVRVTAPDRKTTGEYAIQCDIAPAVPDITPSSGVIFSDTDISISSSMSDLEIRYTLDGSVPGPASLLYTGPFRLASGASVRAVTVYNGQAGAESSALYTLEGKPLMVNVDAGSYSVPSKPETVYDVDAFLIAKLEVTEDLYSLVMTGSPSADEARRNCAAHNISWYQAIEFCNRLSIREGLKPVYYIDGKPDPYDWPAPDQKKTIVSFRSAGGYRLPTLHEWRYAAWGGHLRTGYHTYAGSDTSDGYAWLSSQSTPFVTQVVGLLLPNELGLYDMSGNASEWMHDADPVDGVEFSSILETEYLYRNICGSSITDYDNAYANRGVVTWRDSVYILETTKQTGIRLARTISDTTVPVTAVNISRTAVKTGAGLGFRLYAEQIPYNAGSAGSTAPVWSSSAPAIAAVDQTGLVSALAEGTALITATIAGKTAACTVHVLGRSYTSKTLPSLSLSGFIGVNFWHNYRYAPAPYQIGCTEVTQEQYLAIMGVNSFSSYRFYPAAGRKRDETAGVRVLQPAFRS